MKKNNLQKDSEKTNSTPYVFHAQKFWHSPEIHKQMVNFFRFFTKKIIQKDNFSEFKEKDLDKLKKYVDLYFDSTEGKVDFKKIIAEKNSFKKTNSLLVEKFTSLLNIAQRKLIEEINVEFGKLRSELKKEYYKNKEFQDKVSNEVL